MARIVFDLDGTLIDSAPDIHRVASLLLAAEGARPITLADARGFVGNGVAVFVERMRAARGIPDSEQSRLMAAFLAQYEEAVYLTRLYPGVPEALDALAAAGHLLGVCTNKPIRPCRAVLAHLGLDRRFVAIVGGDSTPAHKPDPAPLYTAFDQLGEGRRIYVGDSEVDAEAAQRAGVPFLLFTEGYRRCDLASLPHLAAFDRFDLLPGLVRETLAAAA